MPCQAGAATSSWKWQAIQRKVCPAGIPVSDQCKDLIAKVLVGNPTKRFTIQQIQEHPWYLKDLPPGVIHMNDECLKLRDHSAGFQSDTEIQAIVMQAIGVPSHDDEDDYIEEAMVRILPCPAFPVAHDSLHWALTKSSMKLVW